jgi:zinc and cadmium transporter
MAFPSIASIPIAGVDAATLAAGLALTTLAAYAGGASVAFLRLGHRRMQVLLSFTGGILLGVAFLHLLPHAVRAFGGSVTDAVQWVLAGFFLMFLLERAFHGHAHHAVDPEHGPAGGCDHGTDHRHTHDPLHDPATGGGTAARSDANWYGAFAGLAVHSLADGAALAAAMDTPVEGVAVVTGVAPLLAVLLHKPVDAGLIAALMLKSGTSPGLRRTVNIVHALLVPLGAALFLVCLRGAGESRGMFLGAALGLAAGAFLCIAAADLLPEVEFHSHDRLLLSATLALGIMLAAGMTVVEREFAAQARADRMESEPAVDEAR